VEWRLICKAERLLLTASAFHPLVRYQATVPVELARTADRLDVAADWPTNVGIYRKPHDLTRSPVVAISLGTAVANIRGPEGAPTFLGSPAEPS
jgi:predicted RNA polymerase sigma factor